MGDYARHGEFAVAALPDTCPGSFRHYKGGGPYWLIGIARHTETGEQLAAYKAGGPDSLTDLWARPALMFFGSVDVEGETIPRFTRKEAG